VRFILVGAVWGYSIFLAVVALCFAYAEWRLGHKMGGLGKMAGVAGGLTGTLLLGGALPLLGGSRLKLTDSGILWEAGANGPRTFFYDRIEECLIASRVVDGETFSVLSVALKGEGEPLLIGIAPEVLVEEVEKALRDHGVDVKREAAGGSGS